MIPPDANRHAPVKARPETAAPPAAPLPPPPPRQALQTLHRELNASFIIGLPLWRHDAVDDARAMMQIAEQWIPKSHIVGYELGNEVRSGPPRLGLRLPRLGSLTRGLGVCCGSGVCCGWGSKG